MMRMIFLIAAITLKAVPAHAQSPMPEFAVIAMLEERIARRFADMCPQVQFDHAGFDRHQRAMLGQFSNRGVHSRTIGKNFASPQPYRFQRHITAFNTKHGLGPDSTNEDYCKIAVQEAKARSSIGQMLKQVQ